MKVVLNVVVALTVMAGAPVIAGESPAETEGSEEMEAQAEFPEIHWDEMRKLMEKEGPDAVIEFIAGFDDAEQRRKLFSFGRFAFAMNEWEGKNLDAVVAVANAGIAEGLRQAEAATSAEESAKLVDYANVMSYNLSADLAECWPGDTLPRDRRHFEAGLKAADDCIRWREELGKGPGPFAMAYWAKGMHQLSLGDVDGAVENFEKSFDYNVEAAKEEGELTEVSAEAGFGLILAEGYVGLARWAGGDEKGKGRYEVAVAAFREGAEKYPEKKDDFQFGVDQLEWVREKFIK
jgi:tetratricopeptide (TPR) repeat protein